MSRIISQEQLDKFIILLRSDIDRMNEMIESDELEHQDRLDLIAERDEQVKMCEDLGANSN